MKTGPFISVILPVYNAQPFLKEAIESILNQSYSNFEFIIINDGSTDDSEKTILQFNDSRIKYFYQQNKGLGATLNIGLSLCTGKYIARQDQDDISYPDRFKKQIDFLEKNPTMVLLGTRAKILTENSTEIKYHKHATHSADLKFDLLFDNPFVHSSVIFKKSIIDEVGIYTIDRNLYEDYDLWSRMALNGEVANLPDILLDYRHHAKGLSTNSSNFKDDALFEQGLKNTKNLIRDLSTPIIDLQALFHWKKEKYSGTTITQLFEALDVITNKLISMYPNEKDRLTKRKKQYQKIIRSRLNTMARRNQPSFFKMLYLKIENKLLKLHPHVINN